MPTILGANSVSGYEIENSVRFDNAEGSYIHRTPGSAGNRKTWTWSGWVKNCVSSVEIVILRSYSNDDNFHGITLDTNGQLSYISRSSGSNDFYLNTTPQHRDPSAWYHLVFASDTTQGTAANRFKFYVNGTQITTFDSSTYPAEDFQGRINNDVQQEIARLQESGGDGTRESNGYFADVNFIDGAAYDPSYFGQTNSNGVWIPKKYGGSYGNNGFFLEFQQTGTSANASGIGADTSGNTHHFTVHNLAANNVTADTPTNNFATINPLLTNDGSTHSEGNTKLVTPGGPGISGPTIAMTAGKWYAEFTCTAKSTVNMNVGIVRADSFDGNNQMDEGNNVGYMYQNNGNVFHGGANESYGASWAVDDIIGIAFNADNLNVEFFKNGAGQGNYTRITDENTGGDWFMCVGEGQGSNTTATFECNFGNPSVALSSANADADGHGSFEYAPPSGYFALCTKNLAEYGG